MILLFDYNDNYFFSFFIFTFSQKGIGHITGCKKFGFLYGETHLAPEMISALEECKREDKSTDELELQQT
jgi:hypothetical protein